MNDYYLVSRDKLNDGSVTDWEAPSKIYDTPDRFCWAWNPYYLRSKVVFDAMQALADSFEFADEEPAGPEEFGDADDDLTLMNPENIQVSIHYMTLLEFVNSLDHPPDVSETQFAIMQGSRATDSYQARFVSSFHPVQ